MKITIDNQKTEVADWFVRKNIDMLCEQADQAIGNEINYKIDRETEKAYLLDPGNGLRSFWIPKSVLSKIENFQPSKVFITCYRKAKKENNIEYFMNDQCAPTFAKAQNQGYSIEQIFEALEKAI